MQLKFSIKSKIKSYDVIFNSDFNKIIKKYNNLDNLFVIDKKVFNLFVKNKINIKNYKLISSSEKIKDFHYISNFINFFKKRKISKKNKIILLGGGSLQDLVSFTCSIYHRGISWIFLPTTLLSQADSCIGGKNSININNQKNILGNFNPPTKIFICKKFLENIPRKNLYDGLGEIFHILATYNKKKIKLIKKFI